jgi:glycosyltransferase involved in cell wall biosynthesis
VPHYQPCSVCTDGWEATPQAWQRLFPKITLMLCFLHSILKIKDCCMGALRLLEAYRQADAFCLPSCPEPLGLVVVEAMFFSLSSHND